MIEMLRCCKGVLTFNYCLGVHKPHHVSICSMCSTEKVEYPINNVEGVSNNEQDDGSNQFIDATIRSVLKDVERAELILETEAAIESLEGPGALVPSQNPHSSDVIQHIVAASVLGGPISEDDPSTSTMHPLSDLC